MREYAVYVFRVVVTGRNALLAKSTHDESAIIFDRDSTNRKVLFLVLIKVADGQSLVLAGLSLSRLDVTLEPVFFLFLAYHPEVCGKPQRRGTNQTPQNKKTQHCLIDNPLNLSLHPPVL